MNYYGTIEAADAYHATSAGGAAWLIRCQQIVVIIIMIMVNFSDYNDAQLVFINTIS